MKWWMLFLEMGGCFITARITFTCIEFLKCWPCFEENVEMDGINVIFISHIHVCFLSSLISPIVLPAVLLKVPIDCSVSVRLHWQLWTSHNCRHFKLSFVVKFGCFVPSDQCHLCLFVRVVSSTLFAPQVPKCSSSFVLVFPNPWSPLPSIFFCLHSASDGQKQWSPQQMLKLQLMPL